mmetsp:Transcript_101444/g.257973  ORF Transcript_101444/g.257973 Transcript_101444/m.257973 type:complete len:204 (-) Transcript_101444:64-675(-)
MRGHGTTTAPAHRWVTPAPPMLCRRCRCCAEQLVHVLQLDFKGQRLSVLRSRQVERHSHRGLRLEAGPIAVLGVRAVADPEARNVAFDVLGMQKDVFPIVAIDEAPTFVGVEHADNALDAGPLNLALPVNELRIYFPSLSPSASASPMATRAGSFFISRLLPGVICRTRGAHRLLARQTPSCPVLARALASPPRSRCGKADQG